MGQQAALLLFFCVKVSNALNTGAECESEEGKNIALLSLDNECMVQIPLGENTLASQLIINVLFFFKSVFFMLTGVGLGEVIKRVNRAFV